MTRTQVKKSKKVRPDLQKAAKEAIEETVFWHTCAITSTHTKSGFPDSGTGTGIEWEGRLFILTANHVVDEFKTSDLEFAFRPPGTLERTLWWQTNSPETKLARRAQSISVIGRFNNPRYDLAALEVGAALKNQLRFYRLHEGSKILRPIRSTFCAIGIPFDSFEHLGPGAAAFSPHALWGNCVRAKRKWSQLHSHQHNPRDHMLMEFTPAGEGRKPHGFSGAGAWHQIYSEKTPIVWAPALDFAGIITHYFGDNKTLQVCRVEKVVRFLTTIPSPLSPEEPR